jgi:hypothetical protein
MGFLEENEHFLLMDVAYSRPPEGEWNIHLNDRDMAALRGVGIKTALPFGCRWDKIEPSKGIYDWSELDTYVERVHNLGMKVVLFTPSFYPQWFPDDWYVKTASGINKGALSPWCMEAMDYYQKFIELMKVRYTFPTTMVALSHLSDGETYLLNEAAFYDDHAIECYKRIYGEKAFPVPNDLDTEKWFKSYLIGMMLRLQRPLVETPHREIWAMAHPAIANFDLYGNGCKFIPDVLHAYQTCLNPSTINHIYYTWIQWPMYWPLMNEWSIKYNENIFGGAEYTEGLATTTPAAIQQSLRGQIIAPCYPGSHQSVDAEMLSRIKAANALWESA